METEFKVRTGEFEGPLDLLLSLIEKRKLHINDVSLSKVADDYIAYTRNLGQFPLSDTAHFVLIASTLVLIKSKSLLPTLSLTEEEKGDMEDLEFRLKVLEKMRELGLGLRSRLLGNSMFRFEDRPIPVVFAPDDSMTKESLHLALSDLLKNLPKKEFLPKVIVDKVMSLEEMIENITTRVTRELKTSFRDFSGMGKSGKVHVIVSFLAMLELVKQGIIEVNQNNRFDDIIMETDNLTVPKYE